MVKVDGKDTCSLRVCGPLKKVDNLKVDPMTQKDVIEVTTKDGETPKTDSMTGMPLLKAYDKAEYTIDLVHPCF